MTTPIPTGIACVWVVLCQICGRTNCGTLRVEVFGISAPEWPLEGRLRSGFAKKKLFLERPVASVPKKPDKPGFSSGHRPRLRILNLDPETRRLSDARVAQG